MFLFPLTPILNWSKRTLIEIYEDDMRNFFVLINTLSTGAHLFTTVNIESDFEHFIDGRESIVFLHDLPSFVAYINIFLSFY